MNVVAIGAHPDDEAFCIGTLLLCQQRGDRVVTASTSNGERGFGHAPDTPFEKVIATRMAESGAVAAALGGEYVCLGQPDQFVEDTPEARLAVTDLLRRTAADLVLGPPPQDYHPDHIITHALVFNACVMSAVSTVKTDHPPLTKPPALYCIDAVGGLEFQPTHYVDITSVHDAKCDLVRLYASQTQSLQAIWGQDFVELLDIMSRYRGLQSGVAHAEGFKPQLGMFGVRAQSMLP